MGIWQSPPARAEPFLPNVDYGDALVHAGVISPKGDEYYFTVSDAQYSRFTVMQCLYRDGQWGAPAPAEFSGVFSDHGVSFGGDENTMFFASTRARDGREDCGIWSLWRVTRGAEGWLTPEPIRVEGWNDRNQSHPVVAESGRLYFHLNPDNNYEQMFLASCKLDGLDGTSVERLDAIVNHSACNVTPCVSPDERFLIFASYGHEKNLGVGDLYVSARGQDGAWGAPVNLGKDVNSPFDDSNPRLSPDGSFLLFSRRSQEETDGAESMSVHWISMEPVLALIDSTWSGKS